MALGSDSYLIKEIFGPTIQGEGAHAGMPCVFLRFALCNLACSWCDTDFSKEGARSMSAGEICKELLATDIGESRRVIVTGGEPALQWDDRLARTLKEAGFVCHMESNGTRRLKAPIDWLTVSPKPRFHEGRFALIQPPDIVPSECKVVVDGSFGEEFLDELGDLYPNCNQWFLQPCDDECRDERVKQSLALVQKRPRWRLSLQLHKILQLP